VSATGGERSSDTSHSEEPLHTLWFRMAARTYGIAAVVLVIIWLLCAAALVLSVWPGTILPALQANATARALLISALLILAYMIFALWRGAALACSVGAELSNHLLDLKPEFPHGTASGKP
jgi:fumarate reductase subunit D